MRSVQRQQSGSAVWIWRLLAIMSIVGMLVAANMIGGSADPGASLGAVFIALWVFICVTVITAIKQIGALKWAIYALIWLFAIGSIYTLALFFCLGLWGHPWTDYSLELMGSNNEIFTLAATLCAILGVAVTHVIVIRREVRLRWAFLVIFIALLPIGGFVFFIVQTVGLGKLIVEAVGKRGIFAASRFAAARKVTATPQGLVEYKSYE